jgi:hypothetical protein
MKRCAVECRPGALANRDLGSRAGQPEHVGGDERIVEHHVGFAEQPGRA